MIVVPAPTKAQDEGGYMLSDHAARVVSSAMQAERFVRDDFTMVPQVRCGHTPDEYTTKERTQIQNHCRQHLEADVRTYRPRVIIPMGPEAAKQVMRKAVKITKVKGVVERSEEFDTLVLPMLSPIQVAAYPQHRPALAADCATLGRLVDHDYDIESASRAVTGDYAFVDDLQFLIDARPTAIGFDTEGSGLVMPGSDALRWYAPNAKLLTMQFCIEPGRAYLLPWDHPDHRWTSRQKFRLKQQIIQLLCHPDVTVIGQNLKFDVLVMLRHLGIRIRIGSDTLMMAALIDENALTKNLDDLTKRYVPEMAGYADRFNATVDKSRLDEHALDQEFLDYGCGDADAVLRLDSVLYPMIEADPRLLAHYNYVALPGLNAFVSVEAEGTLIDDSNLGEFETAMRTRVTTAYNELLRQVPRSIKRLHVDKGLKFTRATFVRDILFDHPDGLKLKPVVFTDGTAKLKDESKKIASVSTKQHLPFFFEDSDFVVDLAQYIKDERLLSTNVVGFKNKYIVDGKVRPAYSLAKAVTGRSATEDPNGQNYPVRGPVAKAYRRLFVAPAGCYYVGADLSQAELRISGDMANEPTMIRIYRTDGDIHIETALIVTGMTLQQFMALPEEERELARFKAKAVNFGFIYGMGWRKFIIYARTQYGVKFTDAEAQRIRNAFFDKYANLPAWHRAVRELAQQNKYVRSYSGRIRHLPMIDSPEEWIAQEAERQAINSPVQGFGSDLGVIALARIDMDIDPRYMSMVSFVHDALYAYVPKQYLLWGARTLKRYMESNPLQEYFNLQMKIPIIADVGFGENLGDMHKLKGLTLGPPPTVRGRAAFQEYDFSKFAEQGIEVPEQLIPPNDGLRTTSIYTGY